jgi:hypothetical protein
MFFASLVCDAQQRKYSATGGGTLNSTNNVACLANVHGIEIENGRRTAGIQNFLYLMIVCPGAKLSPNPTCGSGIDGDPTSEIYYEWETTKGRLRVKFLWDTQSDVVAIGGKKFAREKGNVFLIIRKENGDLEAQQCGTLGLKAGYTEIEQQVRRQVPDSEVIRAVTFPLN